MFWWSQRVLKCCYTCRLRTCGGRVCPKILPCGRSIGPARLWLKDLPFPGALLLLSHESSELDMSATEMHDFVAAHSLLLRMCLHLCVAKLLKDETLPESAGHPARWLVVKTSTPVFQFNNLSCTVSCIGCDESPRPLHGHVCRQLGTFLGNLHGTPHPVPPSQPPTHLCLVMNDTKCFLL